MACSMLNSFGLEKCGGIIGIAGNFTTLLVQKVLNVRLLAESFVKELDFLAQSPLFALQSGGHFPKLLFYPLFQNLR